MHTLILVRVLNLPWSGLAVGALVCAALAGCGTPYSSREQITLTAPADSLETLMVRNVVGRVVLNADPTAGEVRAEVIKIGKGSSVPEAEKALAEIVVRLARTGDGSSIIEAVAEHPGSGPTRNYEVEWRLTAPPGTTLDVSTQVGRILAEGFSAEATFKTDVGAIRATGAYTGLSAQTDVGDIQAESSGRIDVRTDVGSAEVRVLPGEARDVRARTRVGGLDVDVPAGRIGRLKADADVGSLRVRLDELTIHGGSSDRVEADLGGASAPILDLSTEVGHLTVRTYAPERETRGH